MTQNQKTKERESRKFEVGSEVFIYSIEYLITDRVVKSLLDCCMFFVSNLTLRSGGVGSFKTIRAFVPFSAITVAVSLERSSSPDFLLTTTRAAEMLLQTPQDRAYSPWSAPISEHMGNRACGGRCDHLGRAPSTETETETEH